MSVKAEETAWFPENKINATTVSILSTAMMRLARQSGATREEYAAAIAQSAEALTGIHEGVDIDPEVKRFVSERFLAASIALTGGTQ